MFEDIGKPNLATLLTLGLVSVVLPKLLPQMGPAVGGAVKIVIDLLTESEAEAAEELIDALVSSTMAEITKEVARPGDPQQSRQVVERTLEHFKHRGAVRTGGERTSTTGSAATGGIWRNCARRWTGQRTSTPIGGATFSTMSARASTRPCDEN